MNKSDHSNQPYILDTNVFNHLLEGKIALSSFAGRRLLVTGIQVDELSNTPDVIKRAELLAQFEVINPTPILASSFAWGIEGAGWDQACWNDGSNNFEKMRARLCELDSQQKNKKRKRGLQLNQERDILIAETAIKNNAILVSGDHNLRQVVSEFGGCVDDAQLWGLEEDGKDPA